MQFDLLPFAAPLALLLSAGVAFIAPPRSAGSVARLAEAAALLTLLVAGILAVVLVWHGPVDSRVIGLAGAGFAARIDAVSVTLALLVSFVGWIVVRYSATYLDGEPRHVAFTGWLCVTLAAVLLLVLSGDLIELVVAWIATSMGLHRLLIFYPDRVAAQRAARKKFVAARAADVALIAAAVLLAIGYGTSSISAILDAARAGGGGGLAIAAAGLLAIAALLKSAQFPLHGWLTEVMEAPTPVSALLHAGVINAGGFILIRFADVLLLAPGVLAVLVMIGGFTALFGGLVMLTQPAVKTSLAWSTVAQMGFMIMQCGLALFPLALLHIVAHSLYKAHSFLASGGAVDRIALARRPGPVAIPNAKAVGRAFLVALGIYGAIGAGFGFHQQSPQGIALGAILIFGIAYLFAQGFADAAPRALTRRVAVYAVAASVGYFALHGLAQWLTADTLPATPMPGPLEWALIVLAVLSFAVVAVAQAMFPLWAYHPAAAGLRVHLSNGLYANALFDRLLGGWALRPRRATRKEMIPMPSQFGPQPADPVALSTAAEAAACAIPPVWPLASSVAVNPYFGQTEQTLAQTAALLARVAGAPVTMPRGWYSARIADGTVSDDDLVAALSGATGSHRPGSVAALKAAANQPSAPIKAVPTIADLAAEASGIDWPGIIAERFGAWAAAYFDEGQALWAAPKGRSAYAAWQAVATHDLTPEIAGLSDFASFVAEAPETASDAMTRTAAQLGLPQAAAQTYFHSLLITLGGWAQYARYKRWQAQLAGADDATITDFLSIRLLWEEALFDHYAPRIGAQWDAVVAAHAQPVAPTADEIVDAILQEACERAAQRDLGRTLAAAHPVADPTPVILQAAFCIDVRSEVYRRALETVHPGVQTLGFAGFFGLTASHRRFASDVAEHRLPVLLNPGLTSRSGDAADVGADTIARYKARATRAWGRFKLAAVSSFAFVEAAGPVYIAKLLRDAFALHANAVPNDPAPQAEPPLDLETRVGMAASILRAMSLTRDFAPLVLLVGHGANVVNNPHASGLHCGACGGYSGEVNARLLAGLLNDPAIRDGLRALDIVIPAGTLFLAALHDTTTDTVFIYAGDHPSPEHRAAVVRARGFLADAGALTRGERALRLPRALAESSIARRSRDWAETRPEWALAGCKAFIAAPRTRTVGKSLQGRAFLHDYNWRDDAGFGVLELIMTAPVVVASWISLQYYGSSVAPDLFGGGNKLLHNVVGGIGVVEGNGGTLRAGLPWQSVHDGVGLAHEPLRLSVCIEAPREAMSAILERHPGVRALFDNRWLHLFALDDAGRMAWRYTGNLAWEAVMAAEPVTAEPRQALVQP